MKTPSRITPEEYVHAIVSWVAANATMTDAGLMCNRCGEQVTVVPIAFSIHLIEFGDACSGPGEVQHHLVPFCERCEALPEPNGCLHVPWRESGI